MKNLQSFDEFVSESSITENIMPEQVEKVIKTLAYSMPNHTKPDAKGHFSADQVKAAFKYIPDLKYVKDKEIIQEIIDGVLEITNESTVSESLSSDQKKAVDLITKEIGLDPGYFFFGIERNISDFNKLWKAKKYEEALNMIHMTPKEIEEFIKDNK